MRIFRLYRMHLGSLESTQEAGVALDCASITRASIVRYTQAEHEHILKLHARADFEKFFRLLVGLLNPERITYY